MLQSTEDTTVVRGLEKRKACDLCHIKKIRCDTNRPTCSHCVVYGAQCTYTPHIKRRRNEVRVQKNVATTVTLGGGQPESTTRQLIPSAPERALSASNSVTPRLPPLEDALPIIRDYFSNLNSIHPLFSQETFMRSLDESPQKPAVRAAVNVILALAHQNQATAYSPIPSFTPEACISNAQEDIRDPASRENDLLSLQVLLGLVQLYLGTPYPGNSTASSLIGSAIKLVHRMRLHQSSTNALFDNETALQRARLFWVAYILDRALSTQRSEPPLQQDNDHDIAVPPSAHGGGLVRFVTASGAEIDFDVFMASVQLAHIQGTIYDLLYSVRAEAKPPKAHQHNRQKVHGMLQEWMAAIPAELRPDNLRSVSPKPAVRHMVALYFAHLSCISHTYQVGSHDAEWIGWLVDYSQKVVVFPEPGLISNSTPRTFLGHSSTWLEVVAASRDCARLFRIVEQDDMTLIWRVTCIYVCAAIVLVANSLMVSDHGREADADADAELVEEARIFIGRAAAEAPHLGKMHAALTELTCRARIARARFALGRPGPKPASVAWLEAEASRSAGHSALALVEAFLTAEEKPLPTRMLHAGLGGQFA